MKKMIWLAAAVLTPVLLMYAISRLAFASEWGDEFAGGALLLVGMALWIGLLAVTFRWAFPEDWPRK